MRECEQGYMKYFTKEGIFSKPLIWPRIDKATGLPMNSDLMPTYAWYQAYDASMGWAQKIAIKITAQTGSETISERLFKLLKFHVDKRRVALGFKRNDGSRSAPRVLNIAANLHLEEFRNKDPQSEEAMLRSFTLTEEAK